MHNKVLLAKGLCCFFLVPNPLWCRITASMHDPHLLSGCLLGLKTLIGIYGKTFRRSCLLLFIWSDVWLVVANGGGERRILGRSWVGKRPFCALFPCSYHLSSLKNNFAADLLVWYESSCSFSFQFLLFSFWLGSVRSGYSSFAT